jgi:S1-C subfamily serine protease/regulation of enolase protein 1 (concanavalin A-like superfamily)
MPIFLTCPNCRGQGSVPDAFSGGRITCPKCGHRFEVRDTKPAAAPQSAPRPSLFDEDEDEAVEAVQPLATRSVRSAETTPAAPGVSPAVYAAIGLGGIAVVLLGVIAVLLSRGGGHPEPAPIAAAPPVASPKLRPDPAPVPAAPAPVELDAAATLRRLKDATVYIKVKAGNLRGAGSGFVIRAKGDQALVATNRHVISPHLSGDSPEARGAQGGQPEITVVFHSGEGAAREQALPAEVVAADFSEEMHRDLAVLQVRGLSRSLAALDLNQNVEPAETMKYSAYGYPFSDAINFNRGNPSVSVTSGQVSALRRDDHGQLVLIQLDGSVQPGNSGGPIVDERGRLIGVAVAKLAAADTIGLAIPAAELRKVLAGRVGAVDLVLRSSPPDRADLQVKAQVVDPMNRIRAVTVQVVPADSAPALTPNADGSWPPLPGATPVALNLDRATATGQVQVALKAQGPNARRVLLQTAHTDASGQVVYSTPRAIDLPDRAGPILSSSKLDALKRALAARSLAKLGPLVVTDPDPKDSCTLSKDPGGRKATISIPPRIYTLSPQIKQKGKPIHNAPRTVCEVEGDFLAAVQVNGNINPGLDPPLDARGHKLRLTFQGAGLLLYQDKDNFLRLERACWTERAALVRMLLVEVVRDGKEFDYYYIPLPGDAAAPMDIFLIRRQGRYRCLFNDDGKRTVVFREFALDYPNRVKIGLTASNLSRKPFTAQFEDFVLLTDKERIDQEFGR